MFRATNNVLKTSFYIDPKPYEEWSTGMQSKRNAEKATNK